MWEGWASGGGASDGGASGGAGGCVFMVGVFEWWDREFGEVGVFPVFVMGVQARVEGTGLAGSLEDWHRKAEIDARFR